MELIIPIPILVKLLEWEWTFRVQLWDMYSMAEVMEYDSISQHVLKLAHLIRLTCSSAKYFLDQYVCFRPQKEKAEPKNLVGSHWEGQVYFCCIFLNS